MHTVNWIIQLMLPPEITSVEDSYVYRYLDLKPRLEWYRAAFVTLIQFVRPALMPPALHRTASTVTPIALTVRHNSHHLTLQTREIAKLQKGTSN
jgi:hypothetical protein